MLPPVENREGRHRMVRCEFCKGEYQVPVRADNQAILEAMRSHLEVCPNMLKTGQTLGPDNRPHEW